MTKEPNWDVLFPTAPLFWSSCAVAAGYLYPATSNVHDACDQLKSPMPTDFVSDGEHWTRAKMSAFFLAVARHCIKMLENPKES